MGGCPHVDGEGEPNLGALCPTRQIKGMIERRCDVCGDHMPKRLYWLGHKSLVARGYRECPLHLECLLYSAQVCPSMTTKPEGEVWVAASNSMILRQTRVYADGERTYSDNSWRTFEKMGIRSALVGMVAIPDGDVQAWSVEDSAPSTQDPRNERTAVSLFDYETSRHINSADWPFYSLIMAAMRQADTPNRHLLNTAFPAVAYELDARYNAPGGVLESEQR